MTDYKELHARYAEGDGAKQLEKLLHGLTVARSIAEIDTTLRKIAGGLNGADPLTRVARREQAIAALKANTHVNVESPTRFVDAAFVPSGGGGISLHGQTVSFIDPEPWPEPVDGAVLMQEITTWLQRYTVLPTSAVAMLASFVLMSYVTGAFDIVSYVLVSSPTRRCGKTRLLELLELLVHRPWRTVVVTGPVLFRRIEAVHPTLLIDEAEVVRGQGEGAEIVRHILNAGYKRGAKVPRCVGKDNEVYDFDVFGPKLFAAIGRLPPTLFDRCIPVNMRRRHPGERVERFRSRLAGPETAQIRRRLRRWADDSGAQLEEAGVPAPEFLDDRAFEIWEPLLVIGAVVGSGWAERLLDAARALSGSRAEEEEIGPMLLNDLHALFADRGVDRLETAVILEALNSRDDRLWAEWDRGRPLTAPGLAKLLQPFGITPTTIRTPAGTAKGYRREAFADSWPRYVLRAGTPSQSAQILDEPCNGTPPGENAAVTGKPAPALVCDGVTAPQPENRVIPDGQAQQSLLALADALDLEPLDAAGRELLERARAGDGREHPPGLGDARIPREPA